MPFVQVFAVGADDSSDEDSDETIMSGTPGRGRGSGGRIREASVGAQFKQSLAGLIGTISTTQPRYCSVEQIVDHLLHCFHGSY